MAGCAQAAETPPTASPTGFQILFKLDPMLLGPTYGGERWVLAPYGPFRHSGKSYVLEARAEALDNNGQPLQVSFEWEPEDPEMLTVMPSQGNMVAINIQRPGESRVQVTSQGVSKTINIRAAYFRDSAIEIEISQ
jgi:hypothetical protein